MGVWGSQSSNSFNQDGTFCSIMEVVSVCNIQVYTNVSCPHKIVHMVHHLQVRGMGVCQGMLVISTIGSYADL